MSDNPVLKCAQCGQVDDHPKVLIDPDQPSEHRVHYDCLPVVYHDPEVVGPYVAHAVKLAKAGTHGEQLRTALFKKFPPAKVSD